MKPSIAFEVKCNRRHARQHQVIDLAATDENKKYTWNTRLVIGSTGSDPRTVAPVRAIWILHGFDLVPLGRTKSYNLWNIVIGSSVDDLG
eukprot:gene25916-biopygen11739